MSCIFKIKEGMGCYTDTEIRLANYILENPNDVINLNAQELGERVNTSAAAVVRFSKKLGYKGFTTLKVDLAKQSNIDNHETFNTIIKENDSIEVMVKKAEAINIKALNETYKLINLDVLKEAIKALKNCEKIFLYGVGASGLVAIDFQSKLSRINKMTFYNQDSHTQVLTAVHLGPKDVAIGLSYSGETKEVKVAMDKAKKQGATTISITKFNNNSVSKLADYPLYIPCEEEELRVGAMTSRLSTLAVMDLLYLGIIKDEFDKVEKCILETKKIVRQLK
ncbi:MurR/RpiR family transcriptional regulator [Clostridium nigeriense]|uniref:MurR/RpiR family transcriptional regulator n=1 Tax=Clostridium nigeriense TaxID=1805470 RepID=UPI0008319D1F|nr:MurR/RpiR family transcriptional regulator [Clostridium nigeriense]